jgi:AcrR family transcriptional regulator
MAEEQGRKARSAEEREKRIVEAALAVFGERGLAGARLEEIAQRAEVGKGTIYLYFASKDDLFRAVVQHTVVEAVMRFTEAERAGGVEERLRGLLEDFWGYVRSPSFQTMYRLVLGELSQFPELVKSYSQQVSGRVSAAVARLVEEGIAAGVFHPSDPRTTARMIISLFLTHALWSERRELFRHLDERTDEAVLAELVEFYTRAVRSSVVGLQSTDDLLNPP